jgi:hypothetical protein
VAQRYFELRWRVYEMLIAGRTEDEIVTALQLTRNEAPTEIRAIRKILNAPLKHVLELQWRIYEMLVAGCTEDEIVTALQLTRDEASTEIRAIRKILNAPPQHVVEHLLEEEDGSELAPIEVGADPRVEAHETLGPEDRMVKFLVELPRHIYEMLAREYTESEIVTTLRLIKRDKVRTEILRLKQRLVAALAALFAWWQKRQWEASIGACAAAAMAICILCKKPSCTQTAHDDYFEYTGQCAIGVPVDIEGTERVSSPLALPVPPLVVFGTARIGRDPKSDANGPRTILRITDESLFVFWNAGISLKFCDDKYCFENGGPSGYFGGDWKQEWKDLLPDSVFPGFRNGCYEDPNALNRAKRGWGALPPQICKGRSVSLR